MKIIKLKKNKVKCDINELIYESKTDSNIENRLWLPRAGEGWIGSLVTADAN